MRAEKDTGLGAYKALIILLFAAVLVLSYYVASLKSDINALKSNPAVKEATTLQQIVSNLKELPETKNYTTLVSLEELSPSDIGRLKSEQPVIYNNLPEKTLYRAVLANGEESFFVIYDLSENRILRSFGLDQMQLGQ